MPILSPVYLRTKSSKSFFVASILLCVLALLSQKLNIYHFDVIGAIAEIIWLPLLISIFVLPAVGLFNWAKEKFNFRSLYLYGTLVEIATILLIAFTN